MAWVVVFSIIALPVVEIAIFLRVADAIGLLPTVAGAVIAGFAGVALWRSEGLRTLTRAREALARGEMPVNEVFDGLCVLVAGVLLVLPGFLTDVVALVLLLPPVRRLLRGWLTSRMVVVGQAPGAGSTTSRRPGETLVIDADYHEVADDRPPRA